MSKIIKWLKENGIDFEQVREGCVTILLEKDCVWVNGFGEEMKYDKGIAVYKNTYRDYIITEKVGYNRTRKMFQGTRANDAIEVLKERLVK